MSLSTGRATTWYNSVQLLLLSFLLCPMKGMMQTTRSVGLKVSKHAASKKTLIKKRCLSHYHPQQQSAGTRHPHNQHHIELLHRQHQTPSKTSFTGRPEIVSWLSHAGVFLLYLYDKWYGVSQPEHGKRRISFVGNKPSVLFFSLKVFRLKVGSSHFCLWR